MVRSRVAPLLLLAATLVPRSAHAAAQQIVGCSAMGYTMQVPSGWGVAGNCAPMTAVAGPGGLVIVATVERHGWWSDGRSRSSIAADLTAASHGVAMSPVQFRVATTNGQRFVVGSTDIQGGTSTPELATEEETFAAGRMYKFAATAADTRANAAQIEAVWATIRIAGSAAPQQPAQALPPRLISWLGHTWYTQGANLPWFHYGCDFGCNGEGGVVRTASSIAPVLARLVASGGHVVRWWAFPGNPWQISRDASGAPAGLNPAIYADFDQALALAQRYDLYYDFVLFSSPTAIPRSWETDSARRARLASVLGALFAHYKGNPHILAWEVVNEPEWDILGRKVALQAVQATVRAIAESVHRSSGALVTVGSATIGGLPLWVGQGLDFYSPHWYPSMLAADSCAVCATYRDLVRRYGVDKPVVIGEMYGGVHASALRWYGHFYASGFAGAWAWSLFPSQTSDHLAIDLGAFSQFTAQRTGIGPTAH